MEIEVVKNTATETKCKHEVGKVYFDGSSYWFICDDEQTLVNLETGMTICYDSLLQMDMSNSFHVEVKCKLVVME